MCGIIGYVGKKAATPVLLEGLRRLEYRGYDSAGMAVLRDAKLTIRKKKGKIDEGIAHLLKEQPAPGELGIGHTRSKMCTAELAPEPPIFCVRPMVASATGSGWNAGGPTKMAQPKSSTDH